MPQKININVQKKINQSPINPTVNLATGIGKLKQRLAQHVASRNLHTPCRIGMCLYYVDKILMYLYVVVSHAPLDSLILKMHGNLKHFNIYTNVPSKVNV